MRDTTAIKAIMASFFEAPSVRDVLREATALLGRTLVPYREARRRVRDALAEMLQRHAVERTANDRLELRREHYPASLREDVCRDLDRFDVDMAVEDLYKPLEEFPEDLQQFFRSLIARGEITTSDVAGKAAVSDSVYLRCLDEHCRSPFLPARIFDDHPLGDDIRRGVVKPVVRWGIPMVSWDDYHHYSPGGSDPDDWADYEIRASLGLG